MLRIVALAPRTFDAELGKLTVLLRNSGYAAQMVSQPAKHPIADCWYAELGLSDADLPTLRANTRNWVDELAVDITVLPDHLLPFRPRLAVFDMDSTLIQMEVIDELARLAGVGEPVSAITEAAMRGELDFRASLQRRVSLLKGLKKERIDRLFPQIPITPGAATLIDFLKDQGCATAIVSGGFDFVAAHLQRELGIDRAFTNRLAFENGAISGVDGEVVDATRKAQCFQELAASANVSLRDTLAVGDGANDIPMLALAGMSIGYRPKAVLRARADVSLLNVGLDGLIPLLNASSTAL